MAANVACGGVVLNLVEGPPLMARPQPRLGAPLQPRLGATRIRRRLHSASLPLAMMTATAAMMTVLAMMTARRQTLVVQG